MGCLVVGGVFIQGYHVVLVKPRYGHRSSGLGHGVLGLWGGYVGYRPLLVDQLDRRLLRRSLV
jgi:hypothetical protein